MTQGNYVRNSFTEHVVRGQFIERVTVAYNDFTNDRSGNVDGNNADSAKSNLWLMNGFEEGDYGDYNLFATVFGNRFHSVIAMGPLGGSDASHGGDDAQRAKWGVFDSNFVAGVNSVNYEPDGLIKLNHGTSHVAIRNNWLETANATVGIVLEAYTTAENGAHDAQNRGVDHVEISHNTIRMTGTVGDIGLLIGGGQTETSPLALKLIGNLFWDDGQVGSNRRFINIRSSPDDAGDHVDPEAVFAGGGEVRQNVFLSDDTTKNVAWSQKGTEHPGNDERRTVAEWNSATSRTSPATTLDTFSSSLTFLSNGVPVESDLAKLDIVTTFVPGSSYDYRGFLRPHAAVAKTAGSVQRLDEWEYDGNGDWQTNGNWYDGSSPNGAGALVAFGDAITAARTVSLTGNVSAGQVQFNAAHAYTLSAGSARTLTLADAMGGGETVALAAHRGAHVIAANVTVELAKNATAHVASDAALSINGTIASDGTPRTLTKTGQGTLHIASATLGALNVAGGTVSVGNGTSNDPNIVVVKAVPTVSSASARLNLEGVHSWLVVDYDNSGQETSVLTAIRDALLAGLGNGTWNGNSIVTTAGGQYGIGFLKYENLPGGVQDKLDDWRGVADETSILIRPALKGDATLDGVVNFDDLLILAQNYNTSGAFWGVGDFSYEGVVGFDDLLALAQNYTGGDFSEDWELANE